MNVALQVAFQWTVRDTIPQNRLRDMRISRFVARPESADSWLGPNQQIRGSARINRFVARPESTDSWLGPNQQIRNLVILQNHMKHSGSIFTIGIILVIMPLLGFPAIWKNFFVIVAGLWLCGIVLSRLKWHQSKKTNYKKESRYSTVIPASNQTSSETFKDTTSGKYS